MLRIYKAVIKAGGGSIDENSLIIMYNISLFKLIA